VNFAGVPHENYRIGLPRAGRWDEIINTDAGLYGGSGVGNFGAVHAEEVPWHGLPASAALHVPPLGALWLRPAAPPAAEEPATAEEAPAEPATEPPATAATPTDPATAAPPAAASEPPAAEPPPPRTGG